MQTYSMRRTMRPFSLLSFAALAAASLAPAVVQAGSLTSSPYEATPVAPYNPGYTPARDWTGAYAGFSLGYNLRGEDRVQLAPAPGVIGTLRPSGPSVGVQLGHNWQQGSMVYGVEAGWHGTRTRDRLSVGGNTANVRVSSVVELRGRVGMSLGEGLVYTTAGLSSGQINYGASDGVDTISTSYRATGYSLGLGYEHQIQGDWTMRGEYSYTQYRGRNLTAGAITTRATPDFHSVRFGLNRRF